MKSKAAGCRSISTVISSIVLLCVSSIIIIIIIISKKVACNDFNFGKLSMHILELNLLISSADDSGDGDDNDDDDDLFS